MSANGYQPHPNNPLKRPRQEPVSCSFCRRKKLKCNREYPCSNCAARGLECESQVPHQHVHRSPDSDVANASILERLKRLEDMVLGASYPPAHVPGAPISNVFETTIQSKTASPLASEYEEAVQSLEGTGCGEMQPWVKPGSKNFDVRILPTTEIAAIYLHDPSQMVSAKHREWRYFYLPAREEALLFLDIYVRYIDALQHVIYVPHVQSMLDNIYLSIADGEAIVPGQFALLLSILASAAAMFSFLDSEVSITLSDSDALHASTVWTNAALEMLEISRRTYEGVIEDIQATILLGFLLYHTEGFSTRSRGLFASAVSVAKSLSLHKIDAPRSKFANCDPASLEVKRRVFWHVVATDWLLSVSGGPQEGTYTMNPRHMVVKRPRNVDDKDLQHDPPFDYPISVPTTMSYYLQRINLAELCRCVADTVPMAMVDLSPVDYKDVIALDKRFEAFMENLPVFLKTDDQSRIRSEEIMHQYPQLRTQRYALGMIALTRRCKLHQPFLVRGSLKSQYSYSRDVSLQSARIVIRMKRLVEAERASVFEANVKLTGIYHHFFMATIVLVTDLCFHRGHGDDDGRKAEVIEAMKILEEAKNGSEIAAEFLKSLENVLRKHKVRLLTQPNDNNGVRSDTRVTQPPAEIQALANSEPKDTGEPWNTLEDPPSYPSDVDSVWKDYVQLGPNLDMGEWDSLFSDLDATFN